MVNVRELMQRLERPVAHIIALRREQVPEATIRKIVGQLGFGHGYDAGSLRFAFFGEDWVLKAEDPLSDRVVGYGASVRREHEIYEALPPDLRQFLPETHFNLTVPFIVQEMVFPLSQQDLEVRGLGLAHAANKLCDAIPTLAVEDLTWANAGTTRDGRIVFFDWELGIEERGDLIAMGF